LQKLQLVNQMPRPKNSTFADTAIHGAHATLPPRLLAKRRQWLAASREREAQLEALLVPPAPADTQQVFDREGGLHIEAKLDADARLQAQLEYGPRLAPHVPPGGRRVFDDRARNRARQLRAKGLSYKQVDALFAGYTGAPLSWSGWSAVFNGRR
jgi:hypothetical protein